jgi:hypothetical protein
MLTHYFLECHSPEKHRIDVPAPTGEKMRRFILQLTVAGLMLTVGCRSTTPSESFNSNGQGAFASACTEPENPYEEGSGHYAGYEWAESNGATSCGGNSQSFIEGCEEYQDQEAKYEDCEAKR